MLRYAPQKWPLPAICFLVASRWDNIRHDPDSHCSLSLRILSSAIVQRPLLLFPARVFSATLPAAMRLFLIPISTRRALIYARPLRRDTAKELSLLDKATTKTAQTWASWEEAEKGWKKHLVSWGNRVQQRIPFEEWGLKSIPSLNAQRRLDETHGKNKIDVLFPGNSVRLDNIPAVLHTIATERQDLHRRKMWWSFGFAPITAPFGLIPVYVASSFPGR